MSDDTLPQDELLQNIPPTEAVPPPTPPTPLSMGEVLRVPTLRRLWYAQIVSVFGDFLALFAIITVITFDMHGSPQQVTGLNLAYLLPIAVLGILSGVFVDRLPVKPLLVSSDFIRAVLCLGLFFVHNVWGFYVVMGAISVVSSFFGPAQGVAIRSAVPMHGLRSANALMQQVMFVMRIIGGPIAVLIVKSLGSRWCYGLDAASFLASGSLILSLSLKLPATPAAPAANSGSALNRIASDMKTGMGFIWHHAALLFVIVAFCAGMFILGCFGPLIAIYVRDTLMQSARVFAVCSACIGIGLLVGVNVLNTVGKNLPNTLQVYLGLGGIALGTAMLAAAPIFSAPLPVTHAHVSALVAIAACFLIGFTCAGIIVPSQTLIQQETPMALMGRVGSTVMSAVFTAQIFGLLLSGYLADHISLRMVFALCTAMLVALIIAGKLWMEPAPHPAA